MTFSIIPRDDPDQALRIRRMLLAMSMAVIHLAMCCAMYSQGFFRLSFTGFVLFSVALWIGHFSIFTVVRTGLNKRFADPSLTLVQILWTATCVMLTAYFLTELRSVVLMLFLVGMLFGFLRLNFREFLYLSLYAIVLYAAAIGLLYQFHPQFVELDKEIITWFSFSLVTFCFALMGRIINRMRKTLRTSNIQLGKEIEERKRAQEQTQFRKAYFEGLVDNMPDAIAMFDDTGRITEINSRFTGMFGHSEKEALGKNISDLVGPPDRLEEAHAYRRRITSGEIVDVETVRMAKDGSLIDVSLRSAPVIVDHHRIGHFVIYRDISPRKKAEMERSRLESQLQQSRKMEAIATLAGGIAHQFNNALTAIIGNLELLEVEHCRDGRILPQLGAMKTSGHHMAHLTSQLLAYARGGKYNVTTLCLTDFAADTLPLLEHTLKPDIRVETDFPLDIRRIKADRTQMQMVLSALLSNANEAMDGPGRIRISARNIDVDPTLIRDCPGLKPGPYVCLSIEDDGKGMDTETRQRIFEPFFTTHFFGRGLGMPAVYGIVTNHHGIIEVDSELGKGTEVRIYLPAISAGIIDTERPETIEKPGKRLHVGRGTILVIEDEPPVMNLTRTVLERLGYRVLEATTGKEAIDMANSFDGAIDLALMDIKLPDMTGNQIYPLIRDARPEMKVLVCSGYSIDGPAHEILCAGAEGYIQKPFSLLTLSQKLEDVLTANQDLSN
ncbi:MAG: response regulator [Deltaproteobacteria bacterium]|nr:response regulator [Deltaproteobacteria bacterium]